jgi:hypothetical protein
MRAFRYALMLSALFVAPPLYSVFTSVNPTPFLLTVVDQNGRAVPNLQVSTDNGIICRTNSAGNVTWTEPSLMNRRVRFLTDTPGYHLPDDSVLVLHGKRAEIKVTRTPT